MNVAQLEYPSLPFVSPMKSTERNIAKTTHAGCCNAFGNSCSTVQTFKHHHMGKYCGSRSPSGNIESTGGSLTVQFVTNADAVVAGGFRLNFTGVEKRDFEIKEVSNFQQRSICGGSFFLTDNAPRLFVSSSNYPRDYPINNLCMWTVTVPVGREFASSLFDGFKLEPHDT